MCCVNAAPVAKKAKKQLAVAMHGKGDGNPEMEINSDSEYESESEDDEIDEFYSRFQNNLVSFAAL